MQKIEKPLAEVRRWKEKISLKTLKMNTDEVIRYFNSVTEDPKIVRALRLCGKG